MGMSCIYVVILNLGAKWGWVFIPGKKATALIVREAGWVLGPVWTGVEKRNFLATTRVQTPNRPACNVVAMPAPLQLLCSQHTTELQRQAMWVWRNIRACSRNKCCSGKALRITNSECVCVCSLRYPARNAHASYYVVLWPVWLYHIFPQFLINGTIFGWKKHYSTQNACFDFLYKFCLKHFSLLEELSKILS